MDCEVLNVICIAATDIVAIGNTQRDRSEYVPMDRRSSSGQRN